MLSDLQEQLDTYILELENAKELYQKALDKNKYKEASDYSTVIIQLHDKMDEIQKKIDSLSGTNY